MMAGPHLISVLLFLLSILISCESVFRMRSDDDLFYFGETKHTDYEQNRRFCEEIGGSVPSIHSEDDTKFIATLSSTGTCVWVGGRKQNGTYEWDDGSEFDYTPWLENEPSCEADCCGICMGTQVFENDFLKFKTTTCSNTNVRQICRLNFTLPETKEMLLASWDKFSEVEHSVLSSIVFLDFLSNIGNLDERMVLTERELHVKFAQMADDLEEVKLSVRKSITENAERMRDMDHAIETSTKMLMENITSTNESLRESLAVVYNHTNAQFNSLADAINDVIETTDLKIGEFSKNSSRIVNDLKEKVDVAIRQLDEKVERYRGIVNTSLEEQSAAINERVLEVESGLKKQIIAIDSKVENYTNTFSVELRDNQKQESVDSLRTQVEKNTQEMKALILQLTIQVSNLQSEVADLKSKTLVAAPKEAPATSSEQAKFTNIFNHIKHYIPGFSHRRKGDDSR